jgi:CBS domain-containing protein
MALHIADHIHTEHPMTIGSICRRNVVIAPKGESIVDAAKRMRMLHVGTVIVVEERHGTQVPVGILTDRDIVLSVVASDAEHLPFLAVNDAMSDDLLTAGDTSLPDALADAGARRATPPGRRPCGSPGRYRHADDVIRFLADGSVRWQLTNHEEWWSGGIAYDRGSDVASVAYFDGDGVRRDADGAGGFGVSPGTRCDGR